MSERGKPFLLLFLQWVSGLEGGEWSGGEWEEWSGEWSGKNGVGDEKERGERRKGREHTLIRAR